MQYFSFFLLILSFNAFSQHSSFKNFKLKGELQKQWRTQQISQKGLQVKSESSAQTSNSLYRKIFGQENSTGANSPFGSLLFKRINELIKNNYQQIGTQQAQTLLKHQQDFGGDVKNFSGFHWEKPAGTFSIGVNRQLSPDLFNSERWIVHDTFVVSVNATSFLSQLKESNLVDIENESIKAFTGVTWQRVYSTYHFSSSFAAGVMADFSKLFMPFIYFNPEKMRELPQDEILMMEDYFSASAGAVFSPPPVQGFSFTAGAYAKYTKANKVSIQSLGIDDERDNDEFLRISVETSQGQSVGATLALQLDFFNLLKLTLLSADLEYEFERSAKNHLRFYWDDFEEILGHPDYKKDFKKILNGKFINSPFYLDKIVSSEERLQENLSSRYGILVMSKMKKSSTELVRIIKEGKTKTFFTHHSESTQITQGFFSKLLNIFLNQKLEMELAVRNKSLMSKILDIEYESETEEDTMVVESSKKFSITLSAKFRAGTPQDRRFHNKKTQSFIEHYTPLGSEYKNLIKDKKLQGPIEVNSFVRIGEDSINYFNSIPLDEAFYTIARNCGLKKEIALKYKTESYRSRKLRRWRLGKKGCVKNVGNLLLSYREELTEKKQMNLHKLKKFLMKFYKKNQDIRYFLGLFGKDKVFIHGNLEGLTAEGLPFQSFFQTGDFQGFGLVDNYRRESQIN